MTIRKYSGSSLLYRSHTNGINGLCRLLSKSTEKALLFYCVLVNETEDPSQNSVGYGHGD